jgi:hypothetical protein
LWHSWSLPPRAPRQVGAHQVQYANRAPSAKHVKKEGIAINVKSPASPKCVNLCVFGLPDKKSPP